MAIQAALSRRPNPLLLDAASDCGGLDVPGKLRRGQLQAMEEEAVEQARSLLGRS